MIPKLFKSGKSFKTLALYLLHDADKANTAERVRWTHALNTASQDPQLVVNEMLWTYRGADWLKQQAGVPTGGRPLRNPVRHFSLNWHRTEAPSRDQMIEAVESFFRHMGWEGHQALIANHDDKTHPHVHVMLNAVHPETGRALDAGFEWRRASQWAHNYEREHGMIFCEERLKPKDEREASPTREAWEKMKASEHKHDRAEVERVAKDHDYFTRNEPGAHSKSEWELLKEHQRAQREAFFIDGKQAYRSVRNQVFREVRTEYKPLWRAYHEGLKKGDPMEVLRPFKERIIEGQTADLDARRDAACEALRKERDTEYVALLAAQKQERAVLRERQSEGRTSSGLLDTRYPPAANRTKSDRNGTADRARRENLSSAFRQAGAETTEVARSKQDPGSEERKPSHRAPRPERHKVKDGVSAVGDLGLGALGAIAAIGERLFDGFLGGGEKLEEQKPVGKAPARDHDRDAAEDASMAKTESESAAAEAKALKESWDKRHRDRSRD